eukprot:1757351-Alexandrium_andersonii.AAC.1
MPSFVTRLGERGGMRHSLVLDSSRELMDNWQIVIQMGRVTALQPCNMNEAGERLRLTGNKAHHSGGP